ncbi:MAG TPA: hypothetical protein ENN20_06825 [Candidatus Marinimicrobia bacterium]|nr:hypothetical protein [Candidatus Neomarinimicrobiota bacterium]
MDITMNDSAKKSIISKIVAIFWEPSATFQVLKMRIHWTDLVIPMLIVVCVSLVSSIHIIPIALDETKARIENSDALSDTQKEAALEQIEKRANSPFQYVSTVVAIGVKWLVLAAVMLMIGNFFLGGELKYKTLLGVTAYISLIDAVNTGIKTPLIVSQNTTKIYSSLALFMEESRSFFYRFASNIDLFAIWKIILFSIALGTLLNKKANKPFYPIMIIWLLYAVAAALLAGLAKF